MGVNLEESYSRKPPNILFLAYSEANYAFFYNLKDKNAFLIQLVKFNLENLNFIVFPSKFYMQNDQNIKVMKTEQVIMVVRLSLPQGFECFLCKIFWETR